MDILTLLSNIDDAIAAEDPLLAIQHASLGDNNSWDSVKRILSKIVELITTEAEAKKIIQLVPPYMVADLLSLLSTKDKYSAPARVLTPSNVFIAFNRFNENEPTVEETDIRIDILKGVYAMDSLRLLCFIKPGLLDLVSTTTFLDQRLTEEGLPDTHFEDANALANAVRDVYFTNLVIQEPTDPTDYGKEIIKNWHNATVAIA